jgi:predicted dienelactone hydrolase
MICPSILLVCATLLAPAAASAAAVGFQHLNIPDGTNPPLELGIWYPTQAAPDHDHVGLFVETVALGAPVAGHALPLVVMSHGNGGEFAGHSDTAFALAQAGFIVAAPTHTGDNYLDQSRATDLAGRVHQLAAVIAYMEAGWPAHAVDARRVGAFGFSAGGFTVLALAGGNPDLRKVGPHCAAHQNFFDCQLVAAHHLASPAIAKSFEHDPNLRALVVAAPALGFTFDNPSLAAVTMPVQLWRAADDVILPYPFYADAVRAALPTAPEMHVVPHAGHFDFLAPCPDTLVKIAPQICSSEPGFDRVAFHTTFNKQVVAFFRRTLFAP